MNPIANAPVLELAGAVFAESPGAAPVDLTLHRGEVGYLHAGPVALELLGIEAPAGGCVRFFGKTWRERSVAEAEDARRLVGTVFDPSGHPSRTWISNLDVDENVQLASQFDPARRSPEVARRAEELARRFGLPEGLPAGRPANTAAGELVLAQWVRAFLREPIVLLILENALEGAPAGSEPVLREILAEALGAGTAVLWIAESPPPFLRTGTGGKAVLE